LAVVFLYEGMKNRSKSPMKKTICIAASLLAFALTPVTGQPTPPTAPQLGQPGLSPQAQIMRIERASADAQAERERAGASATPLTKFDLDFAGGTPKELVAAIEKATGKQMNVVILDQDAGTQLPAIKLNHVDVSALFQALQAATAKTDYVTMLNSVGFTTTQTYISDYEFDTQDAYVTDDSIWYFSVKKAPAPSKVCRYYLLEPYLDKGLTVDDITTAIKTGWDLQGIDSPPQISFHKETKLLIAVGEPEKLEVIDAVLKALQPSKYNPSQMPGMIDPNTGLPLVSGGSGGGGSKQNP
jgi:hypothetical protein